ncbi:hypothetical protein CEXT_193311 [Caerostris extrusa]|uniref:Uncharacterized protein n=1 Tax=Caerostris extrusa TaxID=172846 RepID=A0AAV4S0P1_CAEEX|nr:hypothetical protein CEXT_193311 [Caerostris extrusa]
MEAIREIPPDFDFIKDLNVSESRNNQPMTDVFCILHFIAISPPKKKEGEREGIIMTWESKEGKCTFIGEEICLFGASPSSFLRRLTGIKKSSKKIELLSLHLLLTS